MPYSFILGFTGEFLLHLVQLLCLINELVIGYGASLNTHGEETEKHIEWLLIVLLYLYCSYAFCKKSFLKISII